MRAFFAAFPLVFLLLVCDRARAQSSTVHVHVVREGETLASIAERYYGDARREKVLVMENGLHLDGATISIGMRLSLPTVAYHRVAEGETWNIIAARYFGTARRAETIIDANPSIRGAVDPGAVIVVPYPLRYVASQTESLVEVARHFYSDPDAVTWLYQFNTIRGDRLERGQVILVPLRDLTFSAEGRRLLGEESSTTQAREMRETQSRIDAELPKLLEQNRTGQYLEALSIAQRLIGTGALTERQELVVQEALGTTYIALERRDLAIAAFRRVLELNPRFSLEERRTSPRVLEALRAARGSQ